MTATLAPPRLTPSGDSAITVEFSREISDDANRRVLALDRALTHRPIDGVREMVPTYRSLLVHYDPELIGFDAIVQQLTALAQTTGAAEPQAQRRWRVPVCYGGEHGVDLDAAAATLALSADELVRRHVEGDYRVAMIGFTPGWSYLSGLDPSLAMSRRHDPRLVTPAGTISIGGVQAGIQCLPGPSGWHLLGRTPVRTFQLRRDPVFLLEPGDAISFAAIDDKTFGEMDAAAARGETIAERIS